MSPSPHHLTWGKKTLTLQLSMRQLWGGAGRPPPGIGARDGAPTASVCPATAFRQLLVPPTPSMPLLAFFLHLPHSSLPLLCAGRLCSCCSLKQGALAPAWTHSTYAGFMPLLWVQAEAMLCAPGCRKDTACQEKVKRGVEGQAGGETCGGDRRKGNGDLRLQWGAEAV